MEPVMPENKAREVIAECADCDICRFLMESDCLVFPELYRLWDKEMETGEKMTSEELRNLVDLCNFCALCPCPPVRANIIEAKTRFVDRDGLKFGIRTLEDVERLTKICGAIPWLSNRLFRGKWSGKLIRKATGIHEERQIPGFPRESFPRWAKAQHLNVMRANPMNVHRKVAYFAGCTANYLFPDVPKAVVEIFRQNDIEVWYPEQKCCGMPSMLEGDRELTLEFVWKNVDDLSNAVASGYDIVCSCPTCGFMLRNVLKEGAYYSSQYQASVGTDEKYLKIPSSKTETMPNRETFDLLKRNIFQHILKDDGYFSSLDPMKRIMVAENTYDVGEYLIKLHRSNALKPTVQGASGRMAYYPPCHLREQGIGRPYLDLLNLLPGINVEPIDGSMYCCGMAGIMGFKKEFHDASIHLGNQLMTKIKALDPDKLITDCLSCRLQFNQLLPYKVQHPVEIIKEAYVRR